MQDMPGKSLPITRNDTFLQDTHKDIYILIGAVIALCSIVLLGWTFQFEYLISPNSNLAAMVPSTAVLMVGSAVALVLTLSVIGPRAKWLVWTLACLVVGLACLDQFLHLRVNGIGLDGNIFEGFRESSKQMMSTMTAFCFVGLGASIILQPSQRRWGQCALLILASIGFIISTVGLLGHLFDASAFYSVSLFRAMSLQTSVAFFLMFLSVLLSRRDIGWMKVFVGQGPGSRNARRLVIPLIGIPVGLCYTALVLSKAGLLNQNFSLSLIATIMIAALFVALLVLAANQNRAHHQQSALIEQLTQTVADRDLLLSEVYHRVKNNLQQINALLFIQAQSQSHQESKDALTSISGRIESLGVVQNLLLASPTRTHLSASDFFGELCGRLEHGLGGGTSHTRLVTEVTDRKITLDAAITLGLLINELVSNAFKHAFDYEALSPASPGVISVLFETDGSHSILTVSDNGKGLSDLEAASLPEGGSGSAIITALTAQLSGSLEIRSKNGTTTRIRIPSDRLEPHS
tara:strand:+ start:3520 stop:5079 length:1560 start_codon:yes stop_codon:yes gene_type:complete